MRVNKVNKVSKVSKVNTVNFNEFTVNDYEEMCIYVMLGTNVLDIIHYNDIDDLQEFIDQVIMDRLGLGINKYYEFNLG